MATIIDTLNGKHNDGVEGTFSTFVKKKEYIVDFAVSTSVMVPFYFYGHKLSEEEMSEMAVKAAIKKLMSDPEMLQGKLNEDVEVYEVNNRRN